ncbi:hypothetical protein FOL47_002389, partial [Perkinsus chesapeaki]
MSTWSELVDLAGKYWIILSDANAYGYRWSDGNFKGDATQAVRGRKIEEWLENHEGVCHNDCNSYTFIRPVSGAGHSGYQCSSVDLTISSNDVNVYSWVSHQEVRPYDHLLIEIKVGLTGG